jgi:hypothetical protein
MPDALQRAVALADGSGQAAASFLAPDLWAWLASPQQGLSATIDSIRGAEAAAGALAQLAPSRIAVVGAVPSERMCWAELERYAQAGEETCVVGLSHDEAGAVSRLVWLRAPLVPGAQVHEEPSVPDALPVLESYFADLMSSRFRQAAAHFARDTIYSHPPYRSGTGRVLFRGRDALRRGFATERGPTPARQLVIGCWQRHDRFFAEGIVEGIPNGGTFVCTGRITPQGEIARYVAFYSARRLGDGSS